MEPINIKNADEKYCRDCGRLVKINCEICPNCGCRQKAYTASGRNRVVAAVLAICLGGLGAHKFYLGKIGVGIVYLLFSWTLIPSLIALVEGIILLSMSETDFERKYS
jgi:TM2 domain-containing membrane protein YozV